MTNFAGKIFTMESYSINTDGSGNAVITLANTPFADDGIMLFCKTALRGVEFVSRVGNQVTVLIRKTVTRTTTTLGSLPSGVSSQATQQSPTSSTPSATSQNGTFAGVNAAPAHTHTTTIDFQYTHTHTVDSNAADVKAVSESGIVVVVGYAF